MKWDDADHRTFALRFRLPSELSPGCAGLPELPGVCRCTLRTIGDTPELAEFERRENYAGRKPGSDLALEAELSVVSGLHPDWKTLRIGVPVTELPPGAELCLQYTGPAFQLLADGRLVNEEFPFGDPSGDVASSAPLLPAASAPEAVKGPLHGWSPAGLNAWAGVVAVAFLNGEFYLFYLFDRRHHASKFGQGGHQWGLLKTRDLRHWTDSGTVLPFTEQWQTFGTGTPFLLDGEVALAYGLHTERLLPDGKAPRGATWATSPDGIHFSPSERVFHTAENPSAYNRPEGGFRMYTGCGSSLELWEAERWPEFHRVRSQIVPNGEASFMRNCLDCPAWFEWHGRHYLLVGFSGMWSAASPDFSEAVDFAARGEDVYDGLGVPMVAPFPGDRRILAGWLPIKGWGGVLGLRELVRHSDGVLGCKWLEEAMPEAGSRKPFASGGATADSFYLEANSKADGFRLRFEGEGEAAEFRIDFKLRRAELLPAGRDRCLTCRELAGEGKPPFSCECAAFAVEKLRGLDASRRVRLLARYEQKWGGTILDAEIAGCRTMLVFFPGLTIRKCAASSPDVRLEYGEC